MRQEASCFCEAKVPPEALSSITASVNWLSDKRYLCVRINHQIGAFSRQSKSRYDRRLYHEKQEVLYQSELMVLQGHIFDHYTDKTR